MSKRVPLVLVGLAGFLLGGLAMQQLPLVHAQDQQVKGASLLHGLSLPCRKGGETEFGKETRKFGVEVFKDDNNGNLIYITETGSIAVVPAK